MCSRNAVDSRELDKNNGDDTCCGGIIVHEENVAIFFANENAAKWSQISEDSSSQNGDSLMERNLDRIMCTTLHLYSYIHKNQRNNPVFNASNK